jgi:hypothetical protein
MYPLLAKDGLAIAYVAVLYFAWLPLALQLPTRGPSKLASSLFMVRRTSAVCLLLDTDDLTSSWQVSMMCVVAIHAARAVIPAPERYPDAFDLLIAVFGCAHFLAALGMAYRGQFVDETAPVPFASTTTKPRGGDDNKKRK